MANEKKRGRVHVDTAGLVSPIWFIGWLLEISISNLELVPQGPLGGTRPVGTPSGQLVTIDVRPFTSS